MRTPQQRMDKIVGNWYLEDPILLGAWTMMDKVVDKNQKTIGINSKASPPFVCYNPNFINSVSDEVLEAIMASEAFKILLRHMTSRLKLPKDVAGLASQITVDQIIMKNLVNTDGFKGLVPMPEDYNLEPNKHFEKYFRDLMENIDEVNDKLDKKYGPSEENEDEEESKEFKNEKDALNEYMNPRSTNTDGWGSNDILDAEIENFVNEKKSSSKLWGKYTSNFVAQIVAANTPKISTKEVVRRFGTSVQTSKQVSTRMKPNRRFGLDVPGRRRINTTKILFAIDVSGSMSDDDLAEGFAVINAVCRNHIVHYMLFDTEIKHVETKFKKARKEFKVTGRGGTNPEPVLKYVDEHKYDGLVIFSDMEFSSNQPRPRRTKVLWLGTDKSAVKPTDFGYFVKLEREH